MLFFLRLSREKARRAAAFFALAAALLPPVSPTARAQAVRVVARPPVKGKHSFYTGNRPPLLPTPLLRLPIGAIRPEGWLRKELELEAEGFFGHLEEISPYLEKKDNAWLSPRGKGKHGWEEVPYWLRGFSNLAYVLGDEKLIARARTWIEGVLSSRRPDGWFGPGRGRKGAATRLKGREDLWPNMVMLSCLRDYYSFTRDERVLSLMKAYFRYLSTIPEDRFLEGYWPKMRGGDLLSSVYWLYNRTGEAFLLALARKVHRHTADWTKGVIDRHNVNICQGFGEPTTFYLQSHDPRHLQASYRNFAWIREHFGRVPGGLFGGDENCRPGYTGPRQAIETCGIVEMMHSAETLVEITGDPLWADRCEDAAFNTLPAALTPDLKALRYLTAPNLVLSDKGSKSPGFQNGGPMLWMNPHIHRCCQHNWGQGWPYFAESLWFATPGGGLAAVFYSDCRVTARAGKGSLVTLDEDTHYPFSGKVTIRVHTEKTVTFPLYLRVPGWCRGARVAVNGKASSAEAAPLRYLVLTRPWKDGDLVELDLPMKVSLRKWTKNHGSVSVDYGPLTFSLKIGEKYVRSGGTDEWPAWEIHPTTPWNYGLVLDPKDPAASFEVIHRPWPETDMPFTLEGTPLEIRAEGKRIPGWKLDHLGLVGRIPESPVLSEESREAITLVPMGAARLRISAFPVIGAGPGAHPWKSPPEPAYKASASHCWRGDTPAALADGILPADSSDHSIPRMTWWDHKGTTEWVQADFHAPRVLSSVQVYWFDDTGSGACRVPASWRLYYREGNRWIPVRNPSGFGTGKDKFNKTTFTPVRTTALRLEVRLRPGFSGGILEWRIE